MEGIQTTWLKLIIKKKESGQIWSHPCGKKDSHELFLRLPWGIRPCP